jgi:hypothetical protein
MTTIADVLQFIEARRADPAQLIGLADKLLDIMPDHFRPAPQARALPGGIPNLLDQASLQFSIFDNRGRKRKKMDSDFGIAISTWAIGQGNRHPAKLNLKLHDAATFANTLKTMRSKQISATWKADMAGLLASHGADWHYAPVVVRYPGFRYIEGQFVLVNLMTLEAVMLDTNTGVVLSITDFVDTTYDGDPLEGNTWQTARIDFTGESEVWATGQHSWDE